MSDDQLSPQSGPDATPAHALGEDAAPRETALPGPDGPAIDLPSAAEVFARIDAAKQRPDADAPDAETQTEPPATEPPKAEPAATEPPKAEPLPPITRPVIKPYMSEPTDSTRPLTTPIEAPTMPFAAATAPTFTPADVPTPVVPDEAAAPLDHETRERMLGNVAQVEDEGGEVPPLTRPDNDKFVGSFGLFWLRLIAAAVLGVRGVQMLLHTSSTATWLTDTMPFAVPEPTIMAWALPIVILIVAVLLVIGFLTRTAAIVVVLYPLAMLVFVRWGAANIFAGAPVEGGFLGDFELLLAGVGLGLAFLGAGGWSFDGHRRLVKARRKLYN